MSHFLRFAVFMIGTFANSIQALLYLRIGKQEVFHMAISEFAGPFSSLAVSLRNAWLAEIVILQAGIVAYLLYGPVLFERRRETRVVRR